MSTAALFTIAKVWKLPKCPPTGEWIKKITHTHTHTHTMEYYSVIKNEILLFATTWVDLEGITLSKISQTERQNTECCYSYVESEKTSE